MNQTITTENEKIIFEDQTIRLEQKESGLTKDIIIKESFIESVEVDTFSDYTTSIILGCVFLSSIAAVYTYLQATKIYFYVSIAMVLFFAGYIMYYLLNNDLTNKIIIKTSNNEIKLDYNLEVFERLIKTIQKEEVAKPNKKEDKKIPKEDYPKFVMKEN